MHRRTHAAHSAFLIWAYSECSTKKHTFLHVCMHVLVLNPDEKQISTYVPSLPHQGQRGRWGRRWRWTSRHMEKGKRRVWIYGIEAKQKGRHTEKGWQIGIWKYTWQQIPSRSTIEHVLWLKTLKCECWNEGTKLEVLILWKSLSKTIKSTKTGP